MPPPAVLAADNFLVPNGTFIFEWIVFVLVVFFIAKKIYPRINEMIEKRQATIKQQFEDAEKAKSDAEKAKKEYQDALAETRKESSRRRDEGNQEKAKISEEARPTDGAAAAGVAEQERAKMDTEREQVLLSLRNEIGELAFT